MGRSSFLTTLLVATFLMLFFSLSHGIGRKTFGSSLSHGDTHRVLLEEKSRVTYELDYIDAGPNFNSHGGVSVSPSPPEPESPPQDKK